MCKGLCRFPSGTKGRQGQKSNRRTQQEPKAARNQMNIPAQKLLLARNRGSNKVEKRWGVKWTMGLLGNRALDGDSGLRSGWIVTWEATGQCWLQPQVLVGREGHAQGPCGCCICGVAKGQGCVNLMRWNMKYLKINTKDHTKQEKRTYRGQMNQKSFYIQ